MATIPEVGPSEFIERWPDFPSANVTLLDVREPHELEVASIPGTLNVPMSEVPARLGELDPTGTVVVLCRSGARSMRVAEFLAANGFGSVYNMKGGINAWSVEVDPTVPRY